MDEAHERNGKHGAHRPIGEHAADYCWNHLMIRCASPDCSLRLKLQPAVLARFRGIHFQNHWYHQFACLKEALVHQLSQLLSPRAQNHGRAHRLPIGLLLVKRGWITPGELREALRMQRQEGSGKLGYWLQRLTSVTEDQICAALGQQWGCPVFPSGRNISASFDPSLPPYPLLAAAKAMPAFRIQNGRQLHIAFSERVDHTLLYALSEMLNCQTFPCVARESAVLEALELLRRQANEHDVCFDSVHDPHEMANIICSYAAQMEVRQLKIVRAASHIWAAFFQREAHRDLLFRLPVARKPVQGSALTAAKASPLLADIRVDGALDAAGPL